jgi:hypothetical protein
MADSLKNIAQDCLGITPEFSVVRDFFGYVYGTPTVQLSLKRQLELVQGPCTDLSIVLVGHENDFSGVVTQAQVSEAQAAIQGARDIYAQVNLGIRRLFWGRIPMDDVGNYAVITNKAEAVDLTDDWNGLNGGIDVFYVQSILNAGGWSTTPGPCDKDDKDDQTGAVIEFGNSDAFAGILLAHEVGHYLGLVHDAAMTNVMGVDSDNDGIGEINGTSTNLTNSQGNTMKSHCSVSSC